MTAASTVVAAGSAPRRLVATTLPQIDQRVGVIFIAANGAVSLRDAFGLPSEYSVSAASTMEAAAELSQGHLFDLVILDLGLSAMGGLTVLRRLKADPRLGMAPVVLVGTYEDMWALRRGLQMGARDYLIRCETTPALVARRVWSWLDQPAARFLVMGCDTRRA